MSGDATLPVVLLGIIAAATLVMALVHLGVIVLAARLARRVEALIGRLEQDVRPVVANAASAAAHAARAAELAAAQVERADRLLADLTVRIDETAITVQRGLLTPAREGRAVIAGVRAALAALLDLRTPSHAGRGHEEDPLFIG
ncbi:MAG TPA: hypothetical protein VK911_00215 [Vicinamibacterales bacterium]|nr:hypothetical protein [Vicinamibacterales bacterium]